MMTDINPFLALTEDLYQNYDSSESLKKIRQGGWNRFAELGLPTIKSETFQYLRLRQFYASTFVPAKMSTLKKEDIEPHILLECRGSVLVFVNGTFQPQLSHTHDLPKRAISTSIAEAYKTFGTLLNNQWNKGTKDEKDPFAAYNSAFLSGGLFLYAPPKTVFETPVQVLHLIDSNDLSMSLQPRVQAFIGAHSEIKLVHTTVCLSGTKFWVNHLTDFSLDEGAQVHYTQTSVNLPSEGWVYDATRATLKKNSSFKSVFVSEGASSIRYDYQVSLTGENGEGLLNGVWMLKDRNEAHTHVLMDHQAPYCRSMQLFKGVLEDLSRSSFEGKILVRHPAQKTQAFQLNNNLLLSDKAIANSKPNLEIFADDVKASHGATVGQLDPEHVFYMKTRGFSDKDAKNLLIHGFCQEVIDLIPIPSLHQILTEKAKNYLL